MSLPADACPIPCNLCGARDIEELSLRDRHGRYLRTTICRRCGLVWSNPRPTEEAVRRYYSHEYRLDYLGRLKPSLRLIARSGRAALSRCHALRPFLRPDDIILDVGAGGGELVYMLRQLGFDAQGIEPDQEYAKHARSELSVPVRTGFVQTVSFPPNSFTFVTMYHSLEHMEDPAGVLSMLRAWIAPGGSLLVEVPNVEATCHAPSHRFHFAHFYSFNGVTLASLGRKAGFEPIQVEAAPDGSFLECLFHNTGTPHDISSMPDNYRRVVGTIANHRTMAHYLTPTPYGRVARRLRAYVTTRLAIVACTAPAQVLDKLMDRAAGNLPLGSRRKSGY